jgi:hypothetical protein
MFGEPFRSIVLATYQARLERKILEGPLLGAGCRRCLETKDEHECGHEYSFHGKAGKTAIAELSIL